jgi:hypothetical protein
MLKGDISNESLDIEILFLQRIETTQRILFLGFYLLASSIRWAKNSL